MTLRLEHKSGTKPVVTEKAAATHIRWKQSLWKSKCLSPLVVLASRYYSLFLIWRKTTDSEYKMAYNWLWWSLCFPLKLHNPGLYHLHCSQYSSLPNPHNGSWSSMYPLAFPAQHSFQNLIKKTPKSSYLLENIEFQALFESVSSLAIWMASPVCKNCGISHIYCKQCIQALRLWLSDH